MLMYFVYWYEENVRREMGGFNSFEKAERWMNNNLDSSIKYAGIGFAAK